MLKFNIKINIVKIFFLKFVNKVILNAKFNKLYFQRRIKYIT